VKPWVLLPAKANLLAVEPSCDLSRHRSLA
jgi:hypothetical protein